VEVITNPSAKYDASGTAGILNIILKKEEHKGLNGSLSLNTGIPNNHGIGMSLNHRTKRFNLFTQLSGGKRTFPNLYNGQTIDRQSSSLDTLKSEGSADKNETFYLLRVGVDYHASRNQVITFSGRVAYEFETEFSDNTYNLVSASSSNRRSFNRLEATEATNPKWEYELQYKKTFPEQDDRSLTASITGSFFGKDQRSAFNNTFADMAELDFRQNSRSDYSAAGYNFQMDYTHPISEQLKMETGAQYRIGDYGNDYLVEEWIGVDWQTNPNFTNAFDFNQGVLGAYATLGFEHGKWGAKAGLRWERTSVRTLLKTDQQTNQQSYANAFPSIHLSYQLSARLSTQLGYSRRIERPGMWDLNPFFDIRDNLNIEIGNAQLAPSFTDVIEFTSIYTLEKASFNISVFHHRTSGLVQYITTVKDSLSIVQPINVGTGSNTGVEWNAKWNPTKSLSLLADLNGQYFTRAGRYGDVNFDFSSYRWSGRLTTKIKLPFKTDVELRARYLSRERRVQAIRKAIFYLDFGLRKKLLEGRVVINFSLRDVLQSRWYINEVDVPSFYRYTESLWGGRTFTLGLSYAIGKGHALEHSGLKTF
ncbi:MAG: outer membrane beta-barrel family protein, partial [Bacteroidota bacterium]